MTFIHAKGHVPVPKHKTSTFTFTFTCQTPTRKTVTPRTFTLPFEFFRNSPSSTVPLRSTGPSRPGQQTHTHSLQLPT